MTSERLRAEDLGREESAADKSPFAAEPGIPGRPRSEITGRHDAGSDANETIDGLTSSAEAARQAAEDIPRRGA